MQNYEQLEVWKKAHLLAIRTYDITRSFPPEEKFGLVSQMRRCSVSIPSNIAEGAGRSSRADFARFLSIALGSASELHYQLRLSRDLGYTVEADHCSLSRDTEVIKRILFGLFARLRTDD
ncbi:MAG: four helix bundle protein [Gammaproteobacteria bacterium]|nr:four helix bundle protein [Gammaproteobacteria bacterium]